MYIWKLAQFLKIALLIEFALVVILPNLPNFPGSLVFNLPFKKVTTRHKKKEPKG